MLSYRPEKTTPPFRRLALRSGMNLIELLVVMGMIGILAGIFLANVKQFTLNYYVAGSASQFQEDIVAAQGEAVNQDADVIMEFDLPASRYRFWMSKPVFDKVSGTMATGPFTVFDVRTGEPPTAPGKEWRYTTVSKESSMDGDRVVFGDDKNIGGGAKGASSGPTITGDLLCFAARTGRVDNCGAAGASLDAFVTLVPDKTYYDRRFPGYAYSATGEMDRPGHTRRVEITYNGDFTVKRWDKAGGKWVQ